MESDADNGTGSDAEKAASFTNELERGMFVLLHVRVGKLEPASIQLVADTGKLVIKTSREGWRAWCYCYNRRYEIVPGQLEPVATRTHTRKLNRSVSLVNGGDSHLAKRVLQRSLSLIRRYPSPESIDLTFATAEVEERMRIWANKNLTIKPTDTASSRDVLKALQGRSMSDVSDIETAMSEDQPTPKPTSKARRVVVQKGPAAVHPAQRRGSVRPLKSQVEHRRSGSSGSSSGGGGGGGGGAVRRASSRSEPGRGWDVPVGVISEADVAGEGDDGDRDLWTWKEPPVQRKLGTVGGSGRGGSGSVGRGGGGGGAPSRGQGIAALSESKPAPSHQQLGRADSARSLSRAAKLEGARAPSAGQREQGSSSDPQADFWNPLGLMSEDSSQPKPTRGLRRGTPLPAASPPPPPPPGSTGSRGAEEGPSQHSVPSASSSRRGSGRGGLRRGVPYTGTAGASLGGESGQGAEEGSSQHPTARGPGDSE